MGEQESSAAARVVFACSGAADVGEIADRAARQIVMQGAGKMSCLAGVGGRYEPIMDLLEAAPSVVVIDGCDCDCAKKCVELAGRSDFSHVRVTDLGFTKGAAPVNSYSIAKTVVAVNGH